MSNVPAELKYTNSDEWVRLESDGSIVMGITDYAQSQLGDMVFVEMQETGQTLSADDECGVIESVKAASEVYMPVAGDVLETNGDVESTPENINADPYGAGWLIKIKPSDASSLDGLIDAAAYQAKLDADDH